MKIPKYVRFIMEKINLQGEEVYIVGGAVRDYLLKIHPSDFDLATSLTPDEVISLFPNKTISHAKRFGTVTVINDFNAIEVSTFRKETEYLDSRHPEEIVFTKSLEEDLKRRDFTINAIAYNGDFIDPFNGIGDLKQKVLNTVGDPVKRLNEDSLRILRAIRFMSILNLDASPELEEALFLVKDKLLFLSKERITEEILKIFDQPLAKIFSKYFSIFKVLFPEISLELKNEFEKVKKNFLLNLFILTSSEKFDFANLRLPSFLEKTLLSAKKYKHISTPLELSEVRVNESYETFKLLKSYLHEVKGIKIRLKNESKLLKVTSKDLIKLGLTGKTLGNALKEIKVLSLTGRLPKCKKKILKYITKNYVN